MNISAETSVKHNAEDYDSSYDYDFFGEPFDFRIKELLKPEVKDFTGSGCTCFQLS